MPYRIDSTTRAARELGALDRPVRDRVAAAIGRLVKAPRHGPGIKRLSE